MIIFMAHFYRLKVKRSMRRFLLIYAVKKYIFKLIKEIAGHIASNEYTYQTNL
jgi:hypothetical protein